jgi:hypothetical protein
VRDDDEGGVAGGRLFRGERPAEHRRDAEDGEESRSDARIGERARIAKTRERTREDVEGGHVGKGPSLGSPIHEVGRRCNEAAEGRDAEGGDDAVGVRIGQATEERGVDDAEDRGIGADGDGQRSDGRQAEDRRGAHAPQRVARVLPERVHVISPLFASLDLAVDSNQVLACVVEIAELGAGAGRGIGGGQTLRNEVGDAGLQMELQLRVDVAVDSRARTPRQAKEAWCHGRYATGRRGMCFSPYQVREA